MTLINVKPISGEEYTQLTGLLIHFLGNLGIFVLGNHLKNNSGSPQ